MSENGGSIDYVATAPKFRGQGINYQLIKFIMEQESYAEFVLEVVANNTSAVRLYEKLGFKEFKRVVPKHAKRSGIEAFSYMSRLK
jgi:ribosomal protein S18 acetylase RimI-like enzyme